VIKKRSPIIQHPAAEENWFDPSLLVKIYKSCPFGKRAAAVGVICKSILHDLLFETSEQQAVSFR